MMPDYLIIFLNVIVAPLPFIECVLMPEGEFPVSTLDSHLYTFFSARQPRYFFNCVKRKSAFGNALTPLLT